MIESITEKPSVAYSVAELALATSLSKSYLRNEIRAGNLKAKKVGKRILILQKYVDDYFEKCDSVKE